MKKYPWIYSSFMALRTQFSQYPCQSLLFSFFCSPNTPFWSDNGMTFIDNKEDNFTTCLTDHLTSFAVLIDYNNDGEKIQV